MIADRYDAFLFDLDGVLFRGSRPIPSAAEALRRLRRAGRRVAFVTNNSTQTPDDVAGKLQEMGIEASHTEVETSALATAELLSGRGVRSAFVVGERGILSALQTSGIRVLDGSAEHAEVVVVGWDRTADYWKLARAALLVERGARLVATNGDVSYPAPEGNLPGAGALLSVIVATTGATPEIVGKPHAPLLRGALARAGGGRPLVVGDRLDTDIAGAAALGWDSLLVLTGITRREDVAVATAKPTYVADDVSGLFA